MARKYFLSGDTHADFSRFETDIFDKRDENCIIILGDSGLNFYKGGKGKKIKEYANSFGYYFYLVRGNHEDRPENIEGMQSVYDRDVQNEVFMEPQYPFLRYLKDGETYCFNGVETLVIGGAYSVDKDYRLENHLTWYPEEQLTKRERDLIFDKVKGRHFDLVLTHTTPYEWRPTERFLSFIDQSTVDVSMEHWLSEVRDAITYERWAAGHFHTNKRVAPGAYIIYQLIYSMADFWDL